MAVVAAGLSSNNTSGACSRSRIDVAPRKTRASAPSTSHLKKSGTETKPSARSRSRESTIMSYFLLDAWGECVQSAKLPKLALRHKEGGSPESLAQRDGE